MILAISSVIISVMFFFTVKMVMDNVRMVTYSKFKFLDVTEEFEIFCMRIITKKFFDYVIKSKTDASGRIVAFREFNDISSEFFQGVVIYIRASIGPEIIRRFKLFYSDKNVDEFLIDRIISIMESYNMILVQRSSMYDVETVNENRARVSRNETSFDNARLKQMVYDKLIFSMNIDMMKLIELNPGAK